MIMRNHFVPVRRQQTETDQSGENSAEEEAKYHRFFPVALLPYAGYLAMGGGLWKDIPLGKYRVCQSACGPGQR